MTTRSSVVFRGHHWGFPLATTGGECLHAGTFGVPDLGLATGADVTYTCTNGNLEASLPLLYGAANTVFVEIDQVTAINCGDT